MDRKFHIEPQDLEESGKLQNERLVKGNLHEKLSLPSTSRCENTIVLTISEEDDTFGYDSSSTNTDDFILSAKTSITGLAWKPN